MYTLYCYPGVSSTATHIALEESGLPFEAVEVDLLRGEQRQEAYLKINPKGRVPALSKDGVTLTENIAILTYLTDLDAARKNAQTEPWARAQLTSLLSFFSSSVHVAFSHIARTDRYTDDPGAYPSIKEKNRATFRTYMEILNSMVADKDWFLSSYSVADAYGVVFWIWGKRAGFDMSEFKHLCAHRDRMLARPAVARVVERERLVSELTTA